MKYDRIFCIGDSITLAANDSRGLGWPGRLGAGLMHGAHQVAIYNLGINGDTSLDIAARWRAEIDARSRNAPGLMLFAFGFNDACMRDGGGVQVPLADSIAAAGRLLQTASALADVLWIGPTPLDESVNPMQTEFASWIMYNADIARYDAAYAELASASGIAYLRLFPDLLEHPRYRAALAAGDGVHPADDGYALIAERIAAWDRWQQLL